MGDKSKIEWTDASWTPIRARYFEIQDDGSGEECIGWHCEHVSEGCRNCYAERMNLRLGTGRAFKPGELYREERKGYNNGESKLFLDEKILLQPLAWKKPRMIFVCSMTDLFADFVPDEWIDRVFAVMALCPQHTFQVLTKRAERMRAYMPERFLEGDHGDKIWSEVAYWRIARAAKLVDPDGYQRSAIGGCNWWPLPNVWLGVSAEDQRRADERIPHLMETPAAVRFVSAEPLLGEISFEEAWHGETALDPECWGDCGWCMTGQRRPLYNCRLHSENADHGKGRSGLDWIIVGGESGPNARPMHPDWARSIRDQCHAAGVPFFFKQWGEHVTGYLDGEDFHVDEEAHGPSVTWNGTARCHDIPGESGHYGRVGKRAAGRLLDAREHNEMPERANG